VVSRLAIEKRCEALRAKHGETRAPIDVEGIARSEGLRVVRRLLDSNVSGLLIRDDGHPAVVGINQSNHPRRQRFTIAHELGHLYLHPGRPYLVDSTIRVNRRDDVSSMATNTEEIEANTFAACLLMPGDLIYDATSRLIGPNSQDVSQLTAILAARFNVSEDAMSFRLHNLGISS
jgi:Zn-dependent peptidase ImmA (M78 family)